MAMNFDSLLKLADKQLTKTQSAVEAQLAERKRRELAERKRKEEMERKEREREVKIRAQRLEDDRRAKEREEQQRRQEVEKEKESERRKEAAAAKVWDSHNGPKRSYPSSTSGRRAVEDEGAMAMALTREEKRERKLQAELRRDMSGSKRPSGGLGYGKSNKKLAGGAVDVVGDSLYGSRGDDPKGSVRARIAAAPNGLVKLNNVKRDTRTIDEILRDRAREKATVIEGDNAKGFSDWFGSKKKDQSKPVSPAPSSVPSRPVSTALLPSPSAKKGPLKPAPHSSTSAMFNRTSATSSKLPSFSKSGSGAKSATCMKGSSLARPVDLKAGATAASARQQKRATSRHRSNSLDSEGDAYEDESPPPRKRARSRTPPGWGGGPNLGDEIWALFGKKKSVYISRDIDSDEEDMEVGMSYLEKEEKISQREARREEAEAEAEERRHAEKKKRRKLEREKRERK